MQIYHDVERGRPV